MDIDSTRLNGRVAVVTGGTHGVGRGIAHELAAAGAFVFVTGRSAPHAMTTDGRVTTLRCDHRHDAEVATTFEHIRARVETIDVLVNAVWGGYDHMIEDGVFTWPAPFWDQPLWRWDAMFAAGVRAHYQASQVAAATMVARSVEASSSTSRTGRRRSASPTPTTGDT